MYLCAALYNCASVQIWMKPCSQAFLLYTERSIATCKPGNEATTVISRVSTHGRLKFTGQRTGVGVYTEKPFVRITHIHTDHRIIKNGGRRLPRDGRLLGRIRNMYLYVPVVSLYAIGSGLCQERMNRC